MQQHRRDDRHNDKNNLERVHHETKQKDGGHDRQHGSGHAARQIVQYALHQAITAETAEHQAEYRCPDQDDEDHACDLGGADHHRHQQSFSSGLTRGKQDRADRTHRRSFRRRRNAGKNGAEDSENEGEGSNENRDELSRECGAVQCVRIGGERRRFFWSHDRDPDYIEHIEQHQDEARTNCAGKQIRDSDRLRCKIAFCQLRRLIGIAELIAEQNEYGCRRKYLGKRGRGRHCPCRQRLVVTMTEHRRQHDQAHRHGGGADDTLGRRKQHADDNNR